MAGMKHVLVLPFPQQGHINPLLTIAELLAPRGFTFTFVVPPHLSVPASAAAAAAGPIRFATVRSDAGDEEGAGAGAARHGGGTSLRFLKELNLVESMRAGCVDLLRELSSSMPVSFILADSFVTWSSQVASQFAIPQFVFFTSSAHTFASFLCAPSLLAKGLLPVRGDPGQRFDGLDGLPPLCARDLPMLMRELPQVASKQVEHIRDAAGVIFNTVEEFERKPLDAARRMVAVYTIGPMLLMQKGSSSSPSSSSSSSSLSMWAEDKQCLSWLDSMPASSVLYVSFGSLATMSMEQIRELAEGLDASGVRFLWVIRPNAVSAAASPVLSESFYEKTRDRGLVITWAPQLAVLSHPSVGGFLTHCGWNSITENLSLGGVPMICWPQVAEQRLNARMLVDDWRIGLDLLQEEDEGTGLVKRTVIERIARDLMQGEAGKELRKRAAELKGIACQAVQEGGSSVINLEALVKDMQKRV